MSYYDRGWAPYVPVAERRRRAVLAMGKLARKGHPVAPVVIAGRAIATTFWGNAWCDNLESYQDYASRLPRGRTYVRNGSVVDLQIAPGEVTAMVSGSSIYRVTVSIGAVGKPRWRSICRDCAGGIDSLVELLQGRLSQGVMERICRQGLGLFPDPKEIRFTCTCPDHAFLCKHVAAALYGVGARLDAAPGLLFRLRGVDAGDLLASVDDAAPVAKSRPTAGKVLQEQDLSAMFGLDMAAADAPPDPPKQAARSAAREKPSGRTKSAKPGRAPSAKPVRRRAAAGVTD